MDGKLLIMSVLPVFAFCYTGGQSGSSASLTHQIGEKHATTLKRAQAGDRLRRPLVRFQATNREDTARALLPFRLRMQRRKRFATDPLTGRSRGSLMQAEKRVREREDLEQTKRPFSGNCPSYALDFSQPSLFSHWRFFGALLRRWASPPVDSD